MRFWMNQNEQILNERVVKKALSVINAICVCTCVSMYKQKSQTHTWNAMPDESAIDNPNEYALRQAIPVSFKAKMDLNLDGSVYILTRNCTCISINMKR